MLTKPTLTPKHITNVKCIAKNTYVLSFERDFEFKAGQVLALDIVADGEPRLYSIASGTNDSTIQILFDEKPDGKLTPRLSKLKIGDTLYVSAPFGTFNCTTDNAYWIAAGTGIAPFVAMARSGMTQNKTLIHGGRLDENFYFSDELSSLLGDNYIRCCSQQPDTLHYKGRLTEWLRNQQNFDIKSAFYLCGSPEMVVEVRDILISKNVPFKNIISETYF